jgi:hypothetical protein
VSGLDKKIDSSWLDVLRVMSRFIRERFVWNTCAFLIKQAAQAMSGLDKKFAF